MYVSKFCIDEKPGLIYLENYFGLSILLALSITASNPVYSATEYEQLSLDFIRTSCLDLEKFQNFSSAELQGVLPEKSPIEYRGTFVGDRFFYQFENGRSVRLDLINPPGGPRRFVLESRVSVNKPSLFIDMDSNCKISHARRLVYQNGHQTRLEYLDASLLPVSTKLLNPPIPEMEDENFNPKLLVAMVDSGVNYLLPEIFNRLGRDINGKMLGYDYWDQDTLPFDAHPAASPFFIQRHGTQTASLMLREAQQVGLVSYRYPRPDMSRMRFLIKHAHNLGLRIIGMPLGSNKHTNWETFENSAKAHPDMLFIVSAGNNGRNIDAEPVYPAGLDLDNMIVVTSADDYLYPAERTNWGKESVDYLLPAERQPVLKFSGSDGKASGSSYAVSRMVALAARLLQAKPIMDTQALKQAIQELSLRVHDGKYVRQGYIPDPLATGVSTAFKPVDIVTFSEPMDEAKYRLRLTGLILDQRWQSQQIKQAVKNAREILLQCEIDISGIDFVAMTGPQYLQDLETGVAHTVMKNFAESPIESHSIKLVFARDSRMQVRFDAEAFGETNTVNRPWLRNSAWIMQGAKDLGITIAHELFHILSNSSGHSVELENLMSSETTPGDTRLTPAQCSQSRYFFSRNQS